MAESEALLTGEQTSNDYHTLSVGKPQSSHMGENSSSTQPARQDRQNASDDRQPAEGNIQIEVRVQQIRWKERLKACIDYCLLEYLTFILGIWKPSCQFVSEHISEKVCIDREQTEAI
ncbi:hypothetical protein HOLleu_24469 [Holothuria leucospilota]|uniref:Uncharacterized protein n=1 Tax=Holothuria leucospilota TaxID=206669 RepID=A0A9Q1H6B9_HOLLE|nr:hypothetical protein HOLleu_24469 [Holothuria leucospilota]